MSKKSWPAASSFPSSRTSSPSSGWPSAGIGGMSSPGLTSRRQYTAYCWPSTVLA